MEHKLALLKEILAEVFDINGASALLDWDQQCYMPVNGAESRGNQQATLSRIAHECFTSDEVGQLLADLQPFAAQIDPDSDDARLIKVTERQFNKQVKVPTGLVTDFAHATTVAHGAWEKARAENNYTHFQPYLEKIIGLRRQYAALFAPYEHVYDPLLDDFEPGLKTSEVQAIFNAIRPQQVALIQAIAARPQVDDSFLHLHYDPQKQWDFGVEILNKFGYDWKGGRQDKAPHPFTTSGLGLGDVRITTRIFPNFPTSGWFSTMHECGHAFYDMGFSPNLDRGPLADGSSAGVHESQSRMWENLVGRSFEFWQHFYPRVQQMFPTQLGNVSLETFYRAINKVQPSLIRVEADEATYNLHVMLRLELEIALVEGALEAKDLPEAWNARMKDYLGILPPTNSDGVLQDIHWSAGLFGYFPSYALGNLMSLQLWERIQIAIPDLSEQVRQGKFTELLAWLRENVHCHGAKFEPQELMQRVTGSKIDASAYLRYLKGKFSKIYGL
jgi:carboxypeptidase Taq